MENKSKIWFSSDGHYGHANIIRYSGRPFGTVESMNECMVERWNECVKDDDTVYYLGDFALDKWYIRMYLPRLKGVKILIAGNHDICHPMFREKAKRNEGLYLDAGFSKILINDNLDVNGLKIRLNHFPYLPGETKEAEERGYKIKYENWRPKPEGEDVLLQGHVHTAWFTKKVEGCPLMINVSVEQTHYRPISLDEVLKIIEDFNKGKDK